jgi:hypothetical protein
VAVERWIVFVHVAAQRCAAGGRRRISFANRQSHDSRLLVAQPLAMSSHARTVKAFRDCAAGNLYLTVAVNRLGKKTSELFKGRLPGGRYGSCYLPRIACRKRHVQRARQENRIGLFESRIGSTGPGAINRVNCWFRPHLRPCLTRPPKTPPAKALVPRSAFAGQAVPVQPRFPSWKWP